jgi:hypothetical protein
MPAFRAFRAQMRTAREASGSMVVTVGRTAGVHALAPQSQHCCVDIGSLLPWSHGVEVCKSTDAIVVACPASSSAPTTGKNETIIKATSTTDIKGRM